LTIDSSYSLNIKYTVLTDPLSVLRQLPPGSAIYCREIISERWEIAWLIREETKRISELGSNPAIEFRAGLCGRDGVMLIPVLVRVGPETQENIYETWINAYQNGDGLKYLMDLSLQDRIVVHFHGDNCRLERSLVVSNQLREFITKVIGLVKEAAPWSMSAFDSAREKLYMKYPDVLSLYDALNNPLLPL